MGKRQGLWGNGGAGQRAVGQRAAGSKVSQEGKQTMLQLENKTLVGDHWAVGTVGH